MVAFVGECVNELSEQRVEAYGIFFNEWCVLAGCQLIVYITWVCFPNQDI